MVDGSDSNEQVVDSSVLYIPQCVDWNLGGVEYEDLVWCLV